MLGLKFTQNKKMLFSIKSNKSETSFHAVILKFLPFYSFLICHKDKKMLKLHLQVLHFFYTNKAALCLSAIYFVFTLYNRTEFNGINEER